MSRWMSVVALLAMMCVALVAHGGDDGGYSYRYFKEARELTLESGSVAVMAPGGRDAARLGGAISAIGALSRHTSAHAVRSWAVVGLEGARGVGAEGVERTVAALAAREDVGFASPVFVDGFGGEMFVTGHVLVRFRDDVSDARRDALLAKYGVGRAGAKDWGGMRGACRAASVSKNGIDVLHAANALAELDEVVFAEPDMVFTGRGGLTPNDTEFGNCWGHRNTGQFGGSVAGEDMDTDLAWDTTIGDPSIIVVVIDTGVDQTHPDVNQVGGNDFTSDASTDGSPINQFDNHGTPVAGCVSATINNNLGVVGSAPGCRSASARTFITTNSSGNWTSSSSWTVNALAWAETLGARVTNNSNGYGFSSAAIESKYASTRSAGMVHFASAGNDNGGAISYPGTLGTVNAVAAVGVDGQRAGFSNIGAEMFISAPGVTVRTTDRQGTAGYSSNSYSSVQGTSFASPYTAGVAALLLSENDQLTASQVETLLATTARDKGASGRDTSYGWGFVNAKAAIDDVVEPAAPGVFDLVTPLDGSSGVSGSIFFSWTASSQVQNYRVLLDDDSDFSSPLIDQLTSFTSLSVPSTSFPDGSFLYWKVVASNAIGDTEAGNAPFTFVTDGPLPGAPSLVLPTDGSSVVTEDVTLTWLGGTNTLWYRVEVDNDPAFGSAEVDEQVQAVGGIETHDVPGAAFTGGVGYHWRITGGNWVGETGSAPASLAFSYDFASSCDGDANGDLVVDVNDISFVLFRLGESNGVCGDGDANGDGVNDVNDISYVLFRLGTCDAGGC